MNLNQTIAELEEQARQYTEAANTLRALAQSGAQSSGGQGGGQSRSNAASRNSGAGASKGGRKAGAGARKKRSNVSPETRARISEALRASHAKKKEAAAGAGATDQAS